MYVNVLVQMNEKIFYSQLRKPEKHENTVKYWFICTTENNGLTFFHILCLKPLIEKCTGRIPIVNIFLHTFLVHFCSNSLPIKIPICYSGAAWFR